MTTLHLVQESGEDKQLHLTVPVERAHCRYDVIVRVHEAETPPTVWPEGFFEQTAGAWRGELTRAPQGEPEIRQGF